MQIPIASPVSQTIIFAVLFLPAFFIFLKKRPAIAKLDLQTTTELKGLAILLVVLSHIGYFLSADNRFLFPFSSLAGVGVDLFLLLSGFGLATSGLNKSDSLGQTYRRRLLRLLVPTWLVITILLILDIFFLKLSYPWMLIAGNYLGFFPEADIFTSLNSPLWYITLILFYFLVFPILFIKKQPWLSAGLILGLSYLLITLDLPINVDVLKLYRLHLWAFPLGIIAAQFLAPKSFWQNLFEKIKTKSIFTKKIPAGFYYWLILLFFIALTFYLTNNSGVGQGILIEQLVSLLTVLSIVAIFILKRFSLTLLYWFGLASFEIYLWHWPLVYRYDFIYKFLPASIATILYLCLFVVLGLGMKKFINQLLNKLNR